MKNIKKKNYLCKASCVIDHYDGLQTLKTVLFLWIMRLAVQFDRGKLFSNFNLVFITFQIIGRKLNMVKLREYWSKCNVLYINDFDSTGSTN